MVEANTRAYKDTGVAPNTSYVYPIHAYNRSGYSGYSNEVLVLTPEGIAPAANGYKVKGRQQVDLEWIGATGTRVDIYRGGSMIATGSDNDGLHTDNIGKRGGGSHTYQLCEEGSISVCSNTVAVTF